MRIKQTEVYDSITGELVGGTSEFQKSVALEEFLQLYLKYISGIVDSLSKGEMQVLSRFWEWSSFFKSDDRGNSITVSKDVYARITEQTGLKYQTIKDAVSSLKRKGMIISSGVGRGTYYLNPEYFFKGKLSDRLKSIECIVKYDISNESTFENDKY